MFQSKEIVFIVVMGTFIIVILLIALFLFFGVYQKRHFRHILEKQELETKFAATLLQSQLEIQEQIFSHLSTELHDNIGQVASLIKIHLTTLRFNDIDKATKKVGEAKDLMRQLIGDIKLLSSGLSSERVLENGLVDAVSTEIERINKTDQFEATFEAAGEQPVIENSRAVILFRMVQEILNNMVKHSSATEIKIKCTGTGNLVILALSDNGSGFDVTESRSQFKGAGLRNLESRARLINAKLTIQSGRGTGSQFTIELPT